MGIYLVSKYISLCLTTHFLQSLQITEIRNCKFGKLLHVLDLPYQIMNKNPTFQANKSLRIHNLLVRFISSEHISGH